MSTVALTGKDTVKINDRILNDQADGDVCLLDYPNDVMGVKTGKNGNSLFAFNNTGRQVQVTLRVLRASADDKYLNGLLAQLRNNPVTFPLMNAEFVKNVGDGAGAVTQDIYTLSGGVFKKQTPAKDNSDGDTEQAVAVYELIFSNAVRNLS